MKDLVQEKTGPLQYVVKVSQDTISKRHIGQLKERCTSREHITMKKYTELTANTKPGKANERMFGEKIQIEIEKYRI